VVGRSADGVVIRGAKLHITAAALAHELLVMPTKTMKPGEEDYAIACAVPVNSPGVHLTTTTYHPLAGDPRDYPVSSRDSMPDSMCIFDDVFVPAERVFLDRPDRAGSGLRALARPVGKARRYLVDGGAGRRTRRPRPVDRRG